MADTTLKEFLLKLNENHRLLLEREAKYGSLAAPLTLINQIEDYERAIEQDNSFDDLQAELNRLNLEIDERIEIAVVTVPKKFTGQNPYRGLERFNEVDAEFFFGRTAATQELLTMTQMLGKAEANSKEPTLLSVLGASGSGKSSLVRVGLIPALRTGQVVGSDRWPIRVSFRHGMMKIMIGRLPAEKVSMI